MTNTRTTIKLRHLQYFVEVAKHLHFSHAAEALFVTQPTLSHQIAELESQIGTPLFNRAGRTVQLTEAGKIFRSYATRALAEVQAGRHALDELEGLQRGTLRIGVSQSFVRKLLPPIMRQFTNRHPAIELQVDELTASQIEHQLVDGQLDIGIAFAPSVLEDTELEPLIEERLLLVMAPQHPFATLEKVPMADLHGQPLALFSLDYSTRQMVERMFEQASARPHVVCQTNSINVMLSRVDGAVMTIIPESAIGRDSELVAVPLCNPSPMRVSALLWARHNFRTLAARSFAQVVREHFKAALTLR